MRPTRWRPRTRSGRSSWRRFHSTGLAARKKSPPAPCFWPPMTAVSWPGPNSASMAAWHRPNDRSRPRHLGSACGGEALDEISSGGVMSLDALRSGAGIDIWHSVVQINGAPMRLAEAGTGPLVVLLHGFPECWYSWRHQLRALAEAGFHAVAPNQRGYPGTHTPAGVADYTMLHLVSDVVGLIGALGESNATVIGHDWGAPVAWHTALLRPDLVRRVGGLSVPFSARTPVPDMTPARPRYGGTL